MIEQGGGVLRRNLTSLAARLAGAKQAILPPGTNAGWSSYGGGGSLLGTRISAYMETYGGDTGVSWIYACTTLVMDELAMYPYQFVDPSTASDLGRCKELDYQRVPDDLRMLLRQPNETMTWFDHINYKEMDTELVGNSYWLKDQRNSFGQPLALQRLRPEYTRIATDRRGKVIGYVYHLEKVGIDLPFEVDEVIHHKLPSPHSEYYGMGRVQGVLKEAGAELGINEHIVGFFTNGARISGVLTVAGTLPEEQFLRMKEQFREEYGGAGNAFSILIAEQGLEFEPITQTPAASGVTDLRELDKDAILSAWGVHEELLGGTANAGDVKMGDAQKIFSRKMRPRARRCSERLTYDLTGAWGQVGLWISTTDVETQETKVARARDMLGAGATINEARTEMGLTPYDQLPNHDPELAALADTPILPSGYEPFYISQQGGARLGGSADEIEQNGSSNGRTEILPGGSNGNLSGTGQPTTPAGEGDRDRQRGIMISYRSVVGRALLALPSGAILSLPEGFEELGELPIKEVGSG